MSWLGTSPPEPIPLNEVWERWNEVSGLRVLVRVDINVPLGSEGQMLCDYRIRRVVGLIGQLSRQGCRVIMMSHLGRPKGRPNPALSLRPLVSHFARHLGPPVTFLTDCIGPEVERAINQSRPGSVFLLENLRFHPGEEAADWSFGQALARLGDCFINDAFSVSHRVHASTVVLPQLLPSYAGPAFVNEYRTAWRMLGRISGPVVGVCGGSNEEKLTTFLRLLANNDLLLLGSGFTRIVKERPEYLSPMAGKPQVIAPADLLVALPGQQTRVEAWERVPSGGSTVDIGPEALDSYCTAIRNAGTVILNGSPGILSRGTPGSSVDRLLAAVVACRGTKIVCGGSGCSQFLQAGLAQRVNFIFPGGGAILTFLANRSCAVAQYLVPPSLTTLQQAAPTTQTC